MKKMIPVILSGGSGTRLWPVSRESYPKQFCEFFDRSFLAESIERVRPFGEPYFVTLESMKNLTELSLTQLSVDCKRVIYEPFGKNTGPAVALLCKKFLDWGLADEIVGVFPSDHLITEKKEFHQVVATASAEAQKNKIVIFGILPRSPETGYGYIELSSQTVQPGRAMPVTRFHEKPSLEVAEKYLASKNFLWNSGIFVFKVSFMIQLFKELQPQMWRQIESIDAKDTNLDFHYANIESISLDYAILEKSKDIMCIPCDMGWSDVGSWDELARLSSEDESPVASSRAAIYLNESENNFVYSQSKKVIAINGVQQLIVVDTPDSLLISKKGESQKVSQLVKKMQVVGAVESAHDFKNTRATKIESEHFIFEGVLNAVAQQKLSEYLDVLLSRDELGFLKSPFRKNDIDEVLRRTGDIQKKQRHLVVVGLGGSQLGGQAFCDGLKTTSDYSVDFWSETDPLFIEEKINDLNNKNLWGSTHFAFISKSGETLELAVWHSLILEALSKNKVDFKEAITVVTEDKKSSLNNWAKKNKICILAHPKDVGGRFSCFTATGLLPAAFLGLDIERLVYGANSALNQKEMLLAMTSYFLSTFDKNKTITVFWSYVHRLSTFQKWLEQLWAESLGQKDTKDLSGAPLVSTPLLASGVSSQHSVLQQFMDGQQDKSFFFFRHQSPSQYKMAGAELEAWSILTEKNAAEVFKTQSLSVEEALKRNQKVTASLLLKKLDTESLGALMMSFQIVVALIGERLNLDVFVQPGVELGKSIALQKLKGAD